MLERAIAARGIYPAIDPLASSSRILDPGVVGEEQASTSAPTTSYTVSIEGRIMPSTANRHPPRETDILARVLGNDRGKLPTEMARYILKRGFTQRDLARMHALTLRNQADDLSDSEKQELIAYVKTGTVLSILKAKARRALRSPAKRHAS